MAKPENYQDVDQRVHEFWERFPNGRIRTEMHRCDEHQVIFLAGVFRDGREGSHPADATGWAEEKVEGRMEKWALETCETSAIGRALANLGLNAKGLRPSSLEMAKPTGKPRRHTPTIPTFRSVWGKQKSSYSRRAAATPTVPATSGATAPTAT